MSSRNKYFSFLALLMLFSCALSSMEKQDQDQIILGPILLFKGSKLENNKLENSKWKVSALYVLKENLHPDLLFYEDGEKTYEISKPKVLGAKWGYEFVRYDMTLNQGVNQKNVLYRLHNMEPKEHMFFVPALGQAANILYHSCNGYQSELDRKKVGGITRMWNTINSRHYSEPFHLQLGGGDQIYVDGLVNKPGENSGEPQCGKTFGVFALPSIKSWLDNKNELLTHSFTVEMFEEVDRFYFDHYVRHYNEPEFKEAMASIPSLAQPDDHDRYDGFGSYPSSLQNSPIMTAIGSIASWYAYTVQHQVNAAGLLNKEQTSLPAYHFLRRVDEGKVAILGVDTRAERTEYQVVSDASWDAIFNKLEKLGPECKHLVVMLAIPVIYASTKNQEEAFIKAGPVLNAFSKAKPEIKNAFGLFELEDDLVDQWGHPNHEDERDAMIARFQDFALKKQIRVSFFSGDTHTGFAGKIYHKVNGIDDNSRFAIWQVTSSPVGNAPVDKITTKFLSTCAMRKKEISNNCAMRLIELDRKNHSGKKSMFAKRNFMSFKLNDDNDLQVVWSVESKKDKPHKLYEIIIPKL